MNYLAGGVNSPIPIPQYYPNNIISGEGPFVFDKNGKKYIDLWMGYGALLFGHADKELIECATDALKKGWFFSYQTLAEKEFSEVLHKAIPSAEVVRYATTGSDSVAYAIRAARAHTKRSKVLTIDGGYHGVHEGMISVEGTSIKETPDYIQFNDIETAKKALETKEYACMILEPVLANAGCTPPEEGYLQALRNLCTETETVLIFDEVVTGIRLSTGGAQKVFGVTPDLSTFSKAIASGLPLSVIAGKKEILERYIPTGDVFFAGTFNGHPLSLAVATKVQQRLEDGKTHEELTEMGNYFRTTVAKMIKDLYLNASIQGYASMLTIAFGCKSFTKGIRNEEFDSQAYEYFISKMAEQGVLFPPLPTESVFLSLVHKKVLDEVLNKIKLVLESMKNEERI